MESTPPQKYRNPPIQEAICEIHFERAQPLEPGDFKPLQAIWSQRYPQQQIVAEKSFQFEFSVERVDAQSKEAGHKLIARSDDGRRLVQLGPRFLAVNRLRPYVGWEEEFLPTILDRFNETQGALGVTALTRIGLRYINRIDIDQAPLNWSEWFAAPLPVPAAVPTRGGHFQSHFRQALDAETEAVLNFGILPPATFGLASIVLDIDVIWRGAAGTQALVELLGKVHQPHRSIFEGYLLDKTRRLFEI